MESPDIAEAFRAQIIVDTTIEKKVLLATAENMFGYLLVKDVHGSWEWSYSDLPYLMKALQSFNIGTKVD